MRRTVLAVALVDSTAGDAESVLTTLREAQAPEPEALDWSEKLKGTRSATSTPFTRRSLRARS